MKIIPAVLAKTREELLISVTQIANLSKYMHLDFADGEFVDNKTVGPEALNGLPEDLEFEIHLMVNHPLDWVSFFEDQRVKKIIFHYESLDDPKTTINDIRFLGIKPGVSLNPKTGVGELGSLIERVEAVLVMTVEPGFQGQDFLVATLKKVEALKSLFPDLPVGVDGGVDKDTFASVLKYKPDEIVIGSAIVKAENAGIAYNYFVGETKRIMNYEVRIRN